MPERLVEVTDSRGYKRLATTPDGRALMTAAGCAKCCTPGGECVRVRRYDRCTATPEIDGCQTLPLLLWLCERTDPPMPGTVKLYNSCYSQTEAVIDTVDVPPGETIVTYFLPNIAGGCADPICTVCAQYYLAEPCPGQNVNGTPPVFVLAERVPVPGPGEDCAIFAVQWPQPAGRICYSVKPGELFNEPRVDELGGHKIVDHLSLGGKCCLCVTGCGETLVDEYFDCGLGTRTINLRCCCSAEWTKSVQVQSTIIVSQITATESIIETEHYGGSATITNTTNPWPTLPWYKLRTEGGVETYYETGERPLPDGGSCAPLVLPPPPGFCPGGGPWSVNDGLGNIQEVVRADTYRTCNSLDVSYRYRFWASDQPGTPRIDHTFTLSIRVRHTGICGGGCGQATGNASDPAGRLVAGLQAASERSPLLAVPRDRWPLWAALIAKGAIPQDKGVGDTFARMAGKVGGEQFKAATKALGLSCGCDARRDRLNALYPYK